MEQHLIVTRHRDPLPVRRPVQRGHRRRRAIDRRMLCGITDAGIRRSVISGSLGDPALDQIPLQRMQRGLSLRHLRLPVFPWGDELQQVALLRAPGRHCRAVFRTREELREVRHDVVALGLGRLVAALTLRLKDRAQLPVVAHRLCGAGAQRQGQCGSRHDMAGGTGGAE